MQSPAGAAREINERFVTGSSARLDLSNVSGDIEISGWDKAEIVLTGTLDPNAELELNHDNKRLDVKVVKKKGARKMRESELFLKVPFQSELSIYAVSSDLDVAGVFGPQRLEVVSGDISVAGFTRDLKVKSVSGNILLQGKGEPARVSVVSVSGNTTVSDAAGELDITSVSGATRVKEGTFERVQTKSTSGRIEFLGGLTDAGRLDAEVISGKVVINLTGAEAIDVELETFSGNIKNCSGEQAVRKSKYGPGQLLQFSRGAANRDVRVRSLSGNVEFCAR